MNKFIIISLLFSFSAFAEKVEVGTFSLYDVKGITITQPSEYRMEVVGYDKETDVYQIEYTSSINGEESIEHELRSADEMNSEEENKMLYELCGSEELKGSREELNLDGVDFKTCKSINEENGSYVYMSSVPFGFVKSFDAESDIEMTIKDFRYGSGGFLPKLFNR
jgi:hypothetical protein